MINYLNITDKLIVWPEPRIQAVRQDFEPNPVDLGPNPVFLGPNQVNLGPNQVGQNLGVALCRRILDPSQSTLDPTQWS